MNLLEETGQRINGHHFIITKAHLEIKKIEDPNHMHISHQQRLRHHKPVFGVSETS